MKLEKGTVYVPVAVECPGFPDPPKSATWNPGKLLLETEKEKLKSGELSEDVMKNYERCDLNTAALRNLQEWIREAQKIDRKFRKANEVDGKPPEVKGKPSK